MSNLPALTDEQMDLIKSTVAKGATDNELKLFLYRCKEIGLDPLKPGQIFFIKYGSGPGTIVIGRDGFRARAAAIGLHTGTKVGIIRDEKGYCLGAWCEVYRKDWSQPAREEVSLKEYDTGKGQWAKMPETMIKKVAEVAALRMAFPDQLSGLYSSDEMEQAGHPPPTKAAAMPMIEIREPASAAPSIRMPILTLDDVKTEHARALQQAIKEDMAATALKNAKWPSVKPAFTAPPGVPSEYKPGDYTAQCGRLGGAIMGHKIKDIPRGDLVGFMKYLRTEASQDYISQSLVQEFIVNAEDYLNEEKGKNK